MYKPFLVSLALTVALLVTAMAQPQVTDALEGLDPVMLVQGKEAQGELKITITRGRFRYLFANEANKAAFEKDPARYEIQLGGACARMGAPVTGIADLYTVHNGRIYIFGSEQCKKLFVADIRAMHHASLRIGVMPALSVGFIQNILKSYVEAHPAARILVHARSTIKIVEWLLAGNIDMMFDAIPAFLPHIREGRVRALAVGSASRVDYVPELTQLPGIGPELAARIIEHRRKHGPFKRTADVIAVRGMSARRYRRIACGDFVKRL